MAVQTDALIHNVDKFAGLTNQTYNNIIKGAQLGIGPRLAYIDSVTPQVFPNAIIIVTHTPTMFDNVPYAKEVLCTLLEKGAKTVDGISPNMSIAELDGFKLQNKQTTKMPGTTGYDDMNPSFTFQEVVGNFVYRFFETWLKWMCHPETGYSQLSSIFVNETIPPFVYSYFTCDFMVIQPDITLQPENIIDGFFITCAWPKSPGGEIGIKREIGFDGETKERSVEFNCIMQRSSNTFKVAQTILDILQMHRLNFDLAKPITTQIEDKLKETGVTKTLEELKQELIEV